MPCLFCLVIFCVVVPADLLLRLLNVLTSCLYCGICTRGLSDLLLSTRGRMDRCFVCFCCPRATRGLIAQFYRSLCVYPRPFSTVVFLPCCDYPRLFQPFVFLFASYPWSFALTVVFIASTHGRCYFRPLSSTHGRLRFDLSLLLRCVYPLSPSLASVPLVMLTFVLCILLFVCTTLPLFEVGVAMVAKIRTVTATSSFVDFRLMIAEGIPSPEGATLLTHYLRLERLRWLIRERESR